METRNIASETNWIKKKKKTNLHSKCKTICKDMPKIFYVKIVIFIQVCVYLYVCVLYMVFFLYAGK